MPPESSPASPLPPPIADYELLRLIGSGSYGDVWLARGVTGVFRAVKIVWRDRFPDVRPYEREFEGITRFAAISLREPSQLALLHAGRQDAAGFFYYVMELADDTTRGREIEPASYSPCTLKDFAASRGRRLEVAEVVALGTALARALASLHAAGLVHRDIKPSNVILVGGVPKLADVGLVALASAQLTFVGTEGFVPPEGPGAPSADVYSLGKLLYELATGLDRHDWPRLPPDLDTRPDQRALLELNEILVRACEPDARQRFADAAALLDELLLLQAGKSVRRLRRAERRTARTLRFAAVLAAIAGLAGAGAWIEHKRAAKAEAERNELAQQTVYAATIAQVQRALEQNDYGRARRLLAQTHNSANKDDLRGIEWHALSRLAQGDPCEIVRNGGEAIIKIAITPDGRILGVHDASGYLALYDADSALEIRRIGEIAVFAGFSADGSWALGTDRNALLQRWHAADGTTGGKPLGSAGVSYQAIGAQGTDRIVAWAASRPPAVTVWDFQTGRELLSLPIDNESFSAPWRLYRGASVDSTGAEAFLGLMSGRSNNLRLRATIARLDQEPSLHHAEALVRPAAFGLQLDGRPSATWWMADDSNGQWATWSHSTGKWEIEKNPLPVGIQAQALLDTNPSPTKLIAHGAVITAQTADRVEKYRGHAALIGGLIAQRDGRHFYSASQSGELRRWDISKSPNKIAQRQTWDHKNTASRALFSTDSSTIFVPKDGRTTLALDARTLSELHVIQNMLRPFAVIEDAVWGLSADGCALVKWMPKSGENPQEFARQESPIVVMSISGDGNQMCLTRNNGELWTISIARPNAPIVTPGNFRDMFPLEQNYDGSRYWCFTQGRALSYRTLPDGRELWKRPLGARPTALRWLPTKNEVVVALENGDICFHNAETGRPTHVVSSGSSAGQSLAVAPDASRLVVAGIEGEVHVIDVRSGRYLAGFQTNAKDTLHYVSLAPNESAIAALTNSGMLHILRIR